MLSQFRVLVDDFPASFAFYRDVLDLKPQEGHPESGPYGCFKGEGTDIALLDRAMMAASLGLPGDVSRGVADHAVLVFRVDDVDAAYGNATARGAASAGEPKDQPGWGMRVAHVRAPEGTLIEFCSYG
ncbi:MAG TPA: VOC family protein [Actinocrinis sp.]|nr:VOC family protein [Actinocrinis sp.]